MVRIPMMAVGRHAERAERKTQTERLCLGAESPRRRPPTANSLKTQDLRDGLKIRFGRRCQRAPSPFGNNGVAPRQHVAAAQRPANFADHADRAADGFAPQRLMLNMTRATIATIVRNIRRQCNSRNSQADERRCRAAGTAIEGLAPWCNSLRWIENGLNSPLATLRAR